MSVSRLYYSPAETPQRKRRTAPFLQGGNAGSIGLNIAVSGVGASVVAAVGTISLNIDVAGVSPTVSTTQTGGHFIPLTRKQEQSLRKQRRKERLAQEAEWDAKRIDADSIAADMRAQLLPTKTIAEVVNEVTANDDDDDDLIALLLNS